MYPAPPCPSPERQGRESQLPRVPRAQGTPGPWRRSHRRRTRGGHSPSARRRHTRATCGGGGKGLARTRALHRACAARCAGIRQTGQVWLSASPCATSTPHCRACDPSVSGGCGNGSNTCLSDSRNSGSCTAPSTSCKFWCGVDCGAGQQCPSGFTCVAIVVTVRCISNADCAGVSPACDTDAGFCLLGGQCALSPGLFCDAPGPPCP